MVFTGFILIAIILEHEERKAPLRPMISEAKELDLSFDQVIKEPDKFLRKHVIWCVQNRSKNEVYYRGDPDKGLTVFNYQQMPLFPGSKHASCSDMLLQVKGVRQTSSGSGIAS